MTTDNSHQHMPEAPGHEPWTAAERLLRKEALHLELDPPAGLEAQVFSALDQPMPVSSNKTSLWLGGAAVVVAVALAWWTMPSDASHVPAPAPDMETPVVPGVVEPEAAQTVVTPLDLEGLATVSSAEAHGNQALPVEKEGQVSTMEALDVSELPAIDNPNENRGLSVKDQVPQHEVRKAKVEVRSEH
jgi:hypothetical protein